MVVGFRPKSGSLTAIAGVIALAIAILLGARAVPGDAAALTRTQASEAVPTRFEGFLKAQGVGKWLVGETSVLVDARTGVLEKRGRAEPGAWVIVWGTRDELGGVHGDLIQVDRPAGRTGPVIQFSGVLSKQLGAWWVIDDVLVQVLDGITQINGAPRVGDLLWVVAENQDTSYRGLAIEVLAGASDAQPVEFEGTIEALSQDEWRVDGYRLIFTSGSVVSGEPAINAAVEVRALPGAENTLTVLLARVLDQDARVALSAASVATHSTADTTADDSSPWSAPVAIATNLNHAARPALAYTPDHVTHALWETNGQLFYAQQRPNAAWSTPIRVAAGTSPVLKVDGAGRLQAVFSNRFLGGYDIYHVSYRAGTWTLPVNISNTSGASYKPALVADAEGGLYAAWMDNSPGYWTIYIGEWDGGFWTNYPVPNARGQTPTLALAADGNLLMAWQERAPTLDNPTGTYAIYLSELAETNRWSMPINVSDQPERDAQGADIAVTDDGFAQLVWIENGQEVRYCFGRSFYWPPAVTVVRAPIVAHGPHIAVERGAVLHVAWDEGDLVRAVSSTPAPGQWPKPSIVAGLDDGAVRDVTLTSTPEGGVAVGWVEVSRPDQAGIYASWQASRFSQHYWLPIALHS